MRTIYFIWAYITSPMFRHYCERNAKQNMINEMRNAQIEEQQYKAQKVYD